MPPKGIPAPPAAESPSATDSPVSDEERVVITYLRHLDRIGGLRTLSLTERALVVGAKSNFEQLAEECDAILNRKVSDLVAGPPAAAPSLDLEDGHSGSATGGTETQYAKSAPAPSSPAASPVQTTGAKDPLAVRLAMLESRLDHFAQLISEISRPKEA